MLIVNDPQERVNLAHKSLQPLLVENYREKQADPQSKKYISGMPDSLRPGSFKNEIYKRGQFTNDWFSHNIPDIYRGLEKSGNKFGNYLEIGSFEGLSTCWMAKLLELHDMDPSITAIDYFGVSEKRGDFGKRFDINVKNFIRTIKMNKLKGDSAIKLAELRSEKAEFDLVYIDGAHDALSVSVDASLSWQMLRGGGVIIFDDYFWFEDKNSKDVLHAVNAFLDFIEGKFRVLNVFHQVMIQKLDSNLPVKVF